MARAVIVRLDPPPDEMEKFDEDLFFDMDAEEQFMTLTKMKNGELEGEEGDAMLTIRPDLVRHLCRNDLTSPEIHVCGRQPASREVMKFLEAESVLSILPKLEKLDEEQILEARNRVKTTREGFSMHLQKLSKDVEQRLQAGESITEIERFAESVVETDLIPDYKEFRRQLAAERRGFWATALDATGKILEIDANPLTPKFWGGQAFQFMKSVESSSVTRGVSR